MRLGRYIFGKISTATAVTDLIGSRLHPVFLPQSAAYPAVVYMVSTVPMDRGMKDYPADHDRATVTFHVWADHLQGQQGYDDLDNIEAALRETLDFVEGTVSGVTVENSRFVSSTDGRDEDRTLILREIVYTMTTKN